MTFTNNKTHPKVLTTAFLLQKLHT